MSRNVHWHEGEISRADRQNILGQKGSTIWFTGLSGCGKSTLAVAVEAELTSRGKLSYRLDGDNIRLGINGNLGFSEEDRAENIRRVGEISKLMADSGVIVLCSFVSPYTRDRESVRDMHARANIPFFEVYVECPLEEAEARDPKGLYKKARAGEIRNFTGIDDPYEAPPAPHIHLRSDQMTLTEELGVVIKSLEDHQILSA